jgi:hypothetical protein
LREVVLLCLRENLEICFERFEVLERGIWRRGTEEGIEIWRRGCGELEGADARDEEDRGFASFGVCSLYIIGGLPNAGNTRIVVAEFVLKAGVVSTILEYIRDGITFRAV